MNADRRVVVHQNVEGNAQLALRRDTWTVQEDLNLLQAVAANRNPNSGRYNWVQVALRSLEIVGYVLTNLQLRARFIVLQRRGEALLTHARYAHLVIAPDGPVDAVDGSASVSGASLSGVSSPSSGPMQTGSDDEF